MCSSTRLPFMFRYFTFLQDRQQAAVSNTNTTIINLICWKTTSLSNKHQSNHDLAAQTQVNGYHVPTCGSERDLTAQLGLCHEPRGERFYLISRFLMNFSHLLVLQLNSVAPVQRPDMVLNSLCHGGPGKQITKWTDLTAALHWQECAERLSRSNAHTP